MSFGNEIVGLYKGTVEMGRGKVFLTGINGFLGSHIATVLIEQGYRVVGMQHTATAPELLKNVDIEMITGDLLDTDTYSDAVSECQIVIHAAAIITFSEEDERMYGAINTKGTQLLLDVAVKSDIQKFVYISSRGTCGVSNLPQNSDETVPLVLVETLDAYIKSKYAAEQLVLQCARQGDMACSVVSPTAMVGSNDEKPTPIGKIIIGALRNGIKPYLYGGINLIDVEDAAIGVVAAIDKGENGEVYFLGTTNIQLYDMLKMIGELGEKKQLFIRLPYSIMYPIAMLATLLTKMIKKPSPLTPRKVYTLNHSHSYCSSRKAVEQLGLPQTPVAVTLGKAVRWFEK